MAIKIAIVGLRHAHIFTMLTNIKSHPEFTLVGLCEEDAATRAALTQSHPDLVIGFNNYQQMLAELDCDVVAVGDSYGQHGPRAIAALKANKHVILDKPLCISLNELAEIRKLSAQKNLKVGLMLDMRDNANVVAAAQLIHSGRIGKITAINFTGQHPLNYGTRPAWYFEPGCHGGTINDIAIHGLDLIELFTGDKLAGVAGARVWNGNFPEVPHFQNGAQFIVTTAGNIGVTGDVSYVAPGFGVPCYWRFDIFGTAGWIEFNYATPGLKAALDGKPQIVEVFPQAATEDYLGRFYADLSGKPGDFDTAHVLAITEFTLKLQDYADGAAKVETLR